MLKKKNVDVELEDDVYEEEEETPKRKNKSRKAKAPKVKEPKQKKKTGFFADEAFEPYTGKICSIQYFVLSLACLSCPLFFLTGGSKAKLARNYMAECGDTDGVSFLAAGKTIRTVAAIEWLVVVLIMFGTVAVSASALLGGMLY